MLGKHSTSIFSVARTGSRMILKWLGQGYGSLTQVECYACGQSEAYKREWWYSPVGVNRYSLLTVHILVALQRTILMSQHYHFTIYIDLNHNRSPFPSPWLWLTTLLTTCLYNWTTFSPLITLASTQTRFLQCWMWRQHVPLKQWYQPTAIHDAQTQKPTIWIMVKDWEHKMLYHELSQGVTSHNKVMSLGTQIPPPWQDFKFYTLKLTSQGIKFTEFDIYKYAFLKTTKKKQND